MSTLILYPPLKRIYFEQIRDGVKPFEYRLANPYWARRLHAKEWTHVEFCLGYPASDDTTRRIRRQWFGYEIQKITHEHFGPKEVEVFAIRVCPT